jgi:hypothetical protein
MRRAILALSISMFACSRAKENPPTPAAPPSPPPPSLASWVQNGITPLQTLSERTLSTGTLSGDDTFSSLFGTANDRLFFRYMVQCALPAGAIVKYMSDADVLEFDGSIGLAPEWATSSCGEACQEWDTACMMARTNYYGIPVQLSIRGPNPALATVSADELTAATVEEGAFYGNMFLDPKVGTACRGSGDDPVSLVVRRCTFAEPGAGYPGAPANCWYFDMGADCAKDCEGRDPNGAFLSCKTTGDGGVKTWAHPLTIYLRHTDFSPVKDGGC